MGVFVEDLILFLLIAIILGGTLLLVSYFIRRPNTSDEEGAEEDEEYGEDSGLKGDYRLLNKGVPDTGMCDEKNIEDGTRSITLDEVYAKDNGLWVCSICETLNKNEDSQCVACGKH
jgi:hypothetical protein